MTLWNIAFTMSGQEHRAEGWIGQYSSASEVFFPHTEGSGWRRLPKSKNKNKPKKIPIVTKAAIVPGYVFVVLDDVNELIRIKDECPYIYGWMQIGETIVAVTDEVLMRMKQVPDRLQALRDEQERLELEARTLRIGDRCIITGGAFEGWELTIVKRFGSVVVFDSPIGEIKAAQDDVEKVV